MRFVQAFNEFDVDGGGNISTKELGWAMRAMGMNPTENALLELINEVQTQNTTLAFTLLSLSPCPLFIFISPYIISPYKSTRSLKDKITLAPSSL